jgi:hypothetical protein
MGKVIVEAADPDFVRPSSWRAPVSKKGGVDVRTKTLRKPLSSVLNEQGE